MGLCSFLATYPALRTGLLSAVPADAGTQKSHLSGKPFEQPLTDDTPPYGCAPYGYYGPEWFVGGVFIGAGPWFHGPANFHGHVNNHFHPDHGYKGPTPHPGDKVETGKEHPPADFHGNETRDGRGHAGGEGPKR